MHANILRRLVGVAFLCGCISVLSSAYSQSDIERATRETDRFPTKEQIEEKLMPPLKEKAPEEKSAEAVSSLTEERFFIRRIWLAGCESFSPNEFFRLTKKYINREVTLTELNNLAKEIEQEYLKLGVIAACFVPPQEIKNQTVTLQVVEAKMGELFVKKSPYFSSMRLRHYWKVYSGEKLRYNKISKSINLMNKNPDRLVKITLGAGQKPGTTDVLLTQKTSFPFHITGSFDNEGSPTTGKGRIGAGFRHNNFLGLDDTFLGGYSFGNYFEGTYFYHSVPVNYDGLSVLYGYSHSVSLPTKEYVSIRLKSAAETSSISLHQDLYDSTGAYFGEVFFGFDAKDKTVKNMYEPVNRDRLRIFSLGANITDRGYGWALSISPEIEQGVSAFGASPSDNPLASRGARANFTKFNLGLQYKKSLPLDMQLNLKSKGLAASKRLTPQEEYSLGGIDSVRGYPSGDYLADGAVNTSAELLIPSVFIPVNWQLPYASDSLRNQTTTVVFVDHGWGMRRGPSDTDKPQVNFVSVGAGLRFNVYEQALLRLEWGFPLADNRPITEAGHSRFHFSVDFQEKMPEELHRIREAIENEHIKRWAWQLVNDEFTKPDSAMARKLNHYMQLAEEAFNEGRFDEAREMYQEVIVIGNSIYRQAEDYVRACIEQEKLLKEYNSLALVNYKEGNFTQARALWEKIISDGEVKSLVIEF